MRRLAVTAAVGALALVAGCASIPTSGPVRTGGDVGLERADIGVPFIGQPPAPGASPVDIVRGFLQSSADFVNDHAVAREYLAPNVRQRWRPEAGTVVYDGPPSALPVHPEEDGTVVVDGTELGRIDVEGAFRRTVSGSSLSRTFAMTKVDDEWRISALLDGLVLSLPDVEETYRQVALYFLSPDGTTVVPDLVLLPQLPGLTTKLMARLLRGPTADLRGAVSSAFPVGTELEVSSVPVSDGLATVDLTREALAADDDAREQISAQVIWTLKQLPEIERVRITAGGEELAVSGVPAEQGRDLWPTYDPDTLPGSPSAYVVREGRVGRYIEGRFQPVAGAAGTGEPALRAPAVSLDAGRIAAVSADGSTVYVGQLVQGAPIEARIRGENLTQPSFDPGNNLWVVDRATGIIWFLADGADRAQQVKHPQLAGNRRAVEVSVARDGARAALVVGAGDASRVVVAGVARSDEPDADAVSLRTVAQPVPDLTVALDVAWADSRTLAVLGAIDGPVSVLYSDVDGYRVDELEPLPDLVSLSTVPPLRPQTNALVAGTADGRLVTFTRGWQPVGPGRDPAYPG